MAAFLTAACWSKGGVVDDRMNLSDKIAALSRAMVGAVPWVGPMLAEIVTALIPNQRLDRAIKYLSTIDRLVEELKDVIRADSERMALIETGLRASANSAYSQKCEWIGNIVNNGLTGAVDTSIAEGLVGIVEQLSQEQIIILYYYCTCYYDSIVKKDAFTQRFHEVFKVRNEFVADTTERAQLENRRKLNHIRLSSLGLIENAFEISRLPEFNIPYKYDKDTFDYLQKQLHKLNENIGRFFDSDDYKPTDLGQLVIKTMLVTEDSLEK
jgi:hypothetical protein